MEDKTQINAAPLPQAQNPITQNEADYEYADIGARVIANLIDAIILSIITIPIIILVGFMQNDSLTTAVSGFISIGQYFYYVYFIGKSGQTLGKKAMKIRVIKLETKDHPDYVGAFFARSCRKIYFRNCAWARILVGALGQTKTRLARQNSRHYCCQSQG